MSRKKKIALIVTGAVAGTILLVALLVFLIFRIVGTVIDKYGLDDMTQTYIEAVIAQDNDKLHTVSYSQEIDAREIYERLKREGILLEGSVSIDGTLSGGVNVSLNNGEKVTTAPAVFKVTVGSERYRVTIVYVEDSGGRGIQSLFIKPR